jgi:hypothetical protein
MVDRCMDNLVIFMFSVLVKGQQPVRLKGIHLDAVLQVDLTASDHLLAGG